MLLALLLMGLLPAYIAHSKGYSFFNWYVYGFLLFPIAIIHSVVLKNRTKVCPFCFSRIDNRATTCKFCQKDLSVNKTKGGR